MYFNISTPDREKAKQLCHINMLKEYHERGTPVGIINAIEEDEMIHSQKKT